MPAARESAALPSVFGAHRDRPFAFLFDRDGSGRPSFAGSDPSGVLVVDEDGRAQVWAAGAWRQQPGDPIDRIAEFVDAAQARPASLPDWLAGHTLPRVTGYLAYELGAWADGPRGECGARRPGVGMPLAVLCSYGCIDASDPSSGRLARIRMADAAPACSPPPLRPADVSSWKATTRTQYRIAFDRILAAIGRGDIYQANLSRRAVFPMRSDPAAAYARLRQVQPVPWGAFLDFGGFALLSNSPECFLMREGERVCTRPIKGTRPRCDDPVLDAAAASALCEDPKEKAEHLMIVDLERNDLGRVARTGSVEVTSFGAVESFATVHHLVSEVQARLRPRVGLAELLRATFPGGSITGAPKIRAMEILAEVEEAGRGPYCGAIGFFDGPERFELSIAIRTAVASGGRALYSTGGGLVADSDPDREWEETEWKIEALRRALDEESPDHGAQCPQEENAT